MAEVDAIVALVAALLLAAGAAKLHRPAPTAKALADAGWSGSTVLVRGLGAVEVLVALAVLLLGGRLAATALLVAYLGVTAVAWRQRRSGADCGCFGASSAPVSWLHLAVNGVAVLVAAVAVAVPPAAAPAALVADGTWLTAAGVVALGAALVLVRAVLTHLPELQAARALHPAEVEA